MTNCYKKGNYLLCLGVESIRFSTTCDHETEYSVGTKVNNPGIKKKKFDLYITYVIMWNIFFYQVVIHQKLGFVKVLHSRDEIFITGLTGQFHLNPTFLN